MHACAVDVYHLTPYACHPPQLLGTLFNVVGKQCIRYAQISGRSQFWFIGVLMWSVVYPVFDISALNFTPESTVFSVDGMIIVWNIALAPYTLREPVTRSKLTAALVVTAGTLGAGAFGSHEDAVGSSEDYMALLCSFSAFVYYVLFLSVVIGALLQLRRHHPHSQYSGLLQGVLAGWFGGCAFFLKVLIQYVREDAWDSGWLYLFAIVSVGYMMLACVRRDLDPSTSGAAPPRLPPPACSHHVVVGIEPRLHRVWCVSVALRRHESVFIVPIYEGVLIFNGAVSGYLGAPTTPHSTRLTPHHFHAPHTTRRSSGPFTHGSHGPCPTP